MERSRMAKPATIAIVLLACSVSRSQGNHRENDSWRSIGRRARAAAGAADEAIARIFRIISSGTSNEKDDELLVSLVKEEIIRTAQSIKTPTGSIEAAARRAQRLVTELTDAYTTVIYKSKTTEEARFNFARFQNTVQKIVDFIKKGQFEKKIKEEKEEEEEEDETRRVKVSERMDPNTSWKEKDRRGGT
ncbi:uncharacterized protein LOC143345692 [Colletes latitarsis]|uniref:uncharacterized protein LOC143345692 n=1 Tax=Colletes latitarsis TaxID=2605962 RepID=UPI004036E613